MGEEHTKYLKETLKKDHKLTTEWDGKIYSGITLDWDHKQRQVHLSMSGYIKKALKQYQHKLRKHQQQPFPTVTLKYGTEKQYTTQESKALLLDATGVKFIQQVYVKFLVLGRAVDNSLLCPISAISLQSSKSKEDTSKQTKQLLDYIATQQEAVLIYHASDTKLVAHSDASYLSKPKARRRAEGHFFLSSNSTVPNNNGAVLNIAHTIKPVISSATEAEIAALYIVAREAMYI